VVRDCSGITGVFDHALERAETTSEAQERERRRAAAREVVDCQGGSVQFDRAPESCTRASETLSTFCGAHLFVVNSCRDSPSPAPPASTFSLSLSVSSACSIIAIFSFSTRL
jgi:hypothetical protein